MGNYRYVINPHTGKYQKVLKDDYIKSIEEIADALAKRHTQNTDEYLTTQKGHYIYVDNNRTDDYTQEGSITKPYKTIQGAIDSITGATVYNRFTVLIAPGEYEEQIVMKNYVNLISLSTNAVWITSSVGDTVTTTVDADLVNLFLVYSGSDPSKVALRVGSGAILILDQVTAYSNYTALEVANSAILVTFDSGTLSGTADSVVIKSGGYASFTAFAFSGYGSPYYDLKVESGGLVDIYADCYFYNERINNLGTIKLIHPTSRTRNDSSINGSTLKDALDNVKTNYLDIPLSSMILTGGLIELGTNAGTVKVNSLTALIRTTDSETGSLTEISLSEQDNISIPLTNTVYNIILKYNAGSPLLALQITNANGNNEIGIGHCMKDDSDNVHFCNCGRRFSSGIAKIHKRQRAIDEIKLASGCIIGEIGTRNITITSGVIYEGINRLAPFSGGIFDTSKSAPDEFTYFYRDGGTGWTRVTGQTQIDNVNYDDNSGILEPLIAQQYGIHWVYLHPDDEHVYIVYGQDSYLLTEVASAIPPPTLPIEIADFAVLIGRIIIQKNSATFHNIQSVITTIFNPAGVEDHNESANLQGGTIGQYYHLTSVEHTNKYIQGNEIKIKVYVQDTEPTLGENQKMAIWEDTGVSGSHPIYLVYRRGEGDQVSVELS